MGSRPSPPKGTISQFRGDYDFLSNFYLAPVTFEGVTYPSVEHAFQAQKATSRQVQRRIKFAKGPGEAKRLGRSINCRKDWDLVKQGIMFNLLMNKFAKQPLRKKLLATKRYYLVEGNTWGDTYWGVCNGEGQNVLGILLMTVRFQLQHKLDMRML